MRNKQTPLVTLTGKRHADVLRAIENTIRDAEDKAFTERNFAFSEYLDSTGRTLPEYRLTEAGFAVIVLGFTGPKATQLRVRFIEEFARMAGRLRQLPEWKEARATVAIGQRSLTDKLVVARTAQGKPTHAHHFINENPLLTFALTGKAKPPVDRNSLDEESLQRLSRIEALNGSLLLAGMSYADARVAA